MFGRLFRLFVLILLAPAVVAFAYEAVLYVVSVFSFDAVKWFLLGVFFSVLLYAVALAGHVDFLEDLGHEVKHGCMSFALTWRLPSRMQIDPEEGSEVRHAGGGCLVSLAPYFLPLLTLPFLAMKVIGTLVLRQLDFAAPFDTGAVFDILIGLALGFDYILVFTQFSFRQTDISKTGYIFSVVVVLFFNLMFLVLVMAVVTESYGELLEFLKGGWARTKEYYKLAYAFLQDTVLPALKDLLAQLLLLICEDCAPQTTG